MMTDGYIRLHRRLLEWDWFTDSATVHVLIYLLLRANWQTRVWRGVTIEPGQVVTSRERIAESTGLTVKQVRRCLETLEAGRVIERDRAGLGQRVTLVHWAEYQIEPVSKGRRKAAERADGGPDRGRTTAANEEGEEREEVEEINTLNAIADLFGKAKALTIEERRERFLAQCKLVTDAEPERLPKDMRRAFVDYWTEPDSKGKMRFEGQKFFAHGRRMDTWRQRSTDHRKTLPKDSASRTDLDFTFGA